MTLSTLLLHLMGEASSVKRITLPLLVRTSSIFAARLLVCLVSWRHNGYGEILVNKGNRPMFHLSGSIRLGMNIGNLF